jgi:hypothetical protein
MINTGHTIQYLCYRCFYNLHKITYLNNNDFQSKLEKDIFILSLVGNNS